jgi:hypothetical protein
MPIAHLLISRSRGQNARHRTFNHYPEWKLRSD